MKSKLLLFSAVAVMGFSVNSYAGAGKGITRCIEETVEQDLSETALAAVLSTTFAPTGTTAWVICVGVNSAEIKRETLKQEATGLLEEGKLNVPSSLGKYAFEKNLSLEDAAAQILSIESAQ